VINDGLRANHLECHDSAPSTPLPWGGVLLDDWNEGASLLLGVPDRQDVTPGPAGSAIQAASSETKLGPDGNFLPSMRALLLVSCSHHGEYVATAILSPPCPVCSASTSIGNVWRPAQRIYILPPGLIRWGDNSSCCIIPQRVELPQCSTHPLLPATGDVDFTSPAWSRSHELSLWYCPGAACTTHLISLGYCVFDGEMEAWGNAELNTAKKPRVLLRL